MNCASIWKFDEGFNLAWDRRRASWLEVLVEGQRVYPLGCVPPRLHFSRETLESEFLTVEEWLEMFASF